jgi:hypothetical protein
MTSSRASVQSSFYSTKDGEVVRSYEIKNPVKRKLSKKSLTEMRLENFANDSINNLIAFFTGDKPTFNGLKNKQNKKIVEEDSIKFQHLGSLIPSTKPDGSRVIIDALNLDEDFGKKKAVKDFIRQQSLNNYRNEPFEVKKHEYTSRWLESSMDTTQRPNGLFANQYRKRTNSRWYENEKKRNCDCIECKSKRLYGYDASDCDCLECRQFK